MIQVVVPASKEVVFEIAGQAMTGNTEHAAAYARKCLFRDLARAKENRSYRHMHILLDGEGTFLAFCKESFGEDHFFSHWWNEAETMDTVNDAVGNAPIIKAEVDNGGYALVLTLDITKEQIAEQAKTFLAQKTAGSRGDVEEDTALESEHDR